MDIPGIVSTADHHLRRNFLQVRHRLAGRLIFNVIPDGLLFLRVTFEHEVREHVRG
jgi:hypothetical protein